MITEFDGIKRLKELANGQKDKFLNLIIDYLCTRKDMNEKFLNPEKDLKGMVEYIESVALGMAEGKNGKKIAKVEDEVVYGWAIHYFDESNSSLGIKNTKPTKTDENNDNIESGGAEVKKDASNVSTKKVKVDAGEQLALF